MRISYAYHDPRCQVLNNSFRAQVAYCANLRVCSARTDSDENDFTPDESVHHEDLTEKKLKISTPMTE